MSARQFEFAGLPLADPPPPSQISSTRKRVTKRFLEAAAYPIVLVIAPAGFGKTTAVRHALAQYKNTIFVTTPHATTLEQFVHAFARGCAQFFPEMASPPHESITNGTGAGGDLELYAAWTTTHLRDAKCIIVIDDLHHADQEHSVAEFLGRITDSLKGRMQWVFSSRTQSNLPVTRWQAYGEADAPITADDLRMTISEVAELASSLNSPATAEQLEILVEQTRGFPVPLAYAVRLSARRGSLLDIMEGTRSFTFDFLAEQLWASLPPAERSLLEIAAFMPPIHTHAYESAGYEKASSVISYLCHDIAFLSLTSAGVFSMHDLFRDFVRLQVSLAGPNLQHERCDSAVEILMQCQRYDEGFELLLESGHSGKLVDAMEQFSSCISDHSVTYRVVCATEHIRPESLGIGALLLQTEYWSWFDEPHKSRLFAEEIIRRTDAPSKHLLSALRSISRVIDSQGPVEQQYWLARMPEILSRLNEADSAQAYACQASLLARFPETQSEARSLIRRVHLKMPALDSIAQVNAQIALASAFFYLGENAAALDATREAVSIARVVKNIREVARTLDNFGLMLMSFHDPEVELIFDPLRDAVEKTGSWRFAHVSHWFQAIYHALKGDIGAALVACDLQLAIIPSEVSQKSRLKAVRDYSKNLCRLISADFQAIIANFELTRVPEEADIAYEILTVVAAAYAFSSEFALCNNILKRAKQLRDSLPVHFMNLVREAVYVEIVVLCSIGLWSQAKRLHGQHGNSASGFASLDDALSLFCQGPPFVAVSDAVGRCIGKPYIGLVALLMKRVIESSRYQSEIPLTAAEVEVLRLLGLGRSNKDIAHTRARSAETIKRQVASIYKKLGVENRTIAVAVARERGLL